MVRGLSRTEAYASHIETIMNAYSELFEKGCLAIY